MVLVQAFIVLTLPAAAVTSREGGDTVGPQRPSLEGSRRNTAEIYDRRIIKYQNLSIQCIL